MNTNLAREEVVNNVVANLYALPTVTKETTGLHKQEETLGYKISKRIVDIIGAMFGIVAYDNWCIHSKFNCWR